MRVGRIVEIMDVYETVNGFYYINKESHTVNSEGFHTEVVCRKATAAEARKYGSGKIKPRKGTSKPKTGEGAQKAQTEDTLTVVTEGEVEEQRVKAEAQRAAGQSRVDLSLSRIEQ